MTSKQTYLVVGVGAAVAAVALIVVLTRGGPDSTATAPPSGSGPQLVDTPDVDWADLLANRPVPPDGYEPWNEQEMREALAETIGEHRDQLELSADESKRLTKTASEALAAYWSADLERYLDLLQSQGLGPTGDLAASNAKSRMTSLTRSVVGAPVDLDGLEVALYARAGEVLVNSSRVGVSAKRVGTPRGENDILDPGDAGADVVSVRVPAWLLSTSRFGGKPFEGAMILYFAQRTADGEWLLIRVDNHNVNARMREDDLRATLPPL